ncbi:unnamed protein product [Euphydryas editha]|uniref:Peptidase aspartic putative domain-containing protein n=1 Tax=Euphydryas editha TaxID=104508 RepID=A0AAU9ULP9_EUPED|nr:unnamed protein product [Euphydryas editha]
MPLTRSQAEKMEQELEAIQERSPENTSNIAEQSKPSNVPVRHEEPPRSPSADPGQRKHSKPSSKKASKEKKLLKLREEIAQRKLELAIARAEAAALESDDDDSEDSSHDGDNRVTEWLDTHPEVTTKPIAQDPEVPIAKPTTHTEKNNSVIIEKEAPEIATVASNSIDLTQLAAAITTAARSAGTSRYIGELPYFNGSHTEWLAFRAAYYESSTQLSAAENSARIRRALKGKAKEAVASLLIANAPAIDIMKTLETRFGRPDAIAITELEKLRNLPRLTDSPRDICAYANKIRNCVATLRLLAKDQYLYSPEIIKQLVEKLTPTTRFRWFDYATSNDIEKPKTEPELVLFCEFIEREADRCAKYAPPEQINNEETTTPVRRHRALVTNDRKFPCPICKEKEHEPSDCTKLKTAEQHRRWEIAKDANLCYRCLRYRSQTHKCKTRVCGKNGCERTHHPLLHFTPTNKEDRREETEKVTTTHSHKELHAYLKYIPVRISGPKKTIDTYALLDDGSTVTLIEESIASKIGAKGPKDPLNIETIDTKLATHSSRRVTFNIKGQEKEFKLQARTIKKMKISPQSINKEQVRACEHLKDIANDISYKDARPTILIGQDNWHLLIASETKKGNRSQLVASKTPLGWVLHGSGSRTVGQRVHFVYNLADTDIESDEVRMDEMLRHHFALDSIDIAEKKPRSDPEHRYAVTADIAEMFMKIGVRSEDRDALRYLWRGDRRDGPPDEYRMKSLIFGATCSPAIAIYVKNANARKYEKEYPEATAAIVQAHYMDDYLDSFTTEQRTIEIATQVRDIHAAGNFNLRSWTSNSLYVQKILNEESESSQEIKQLDDGTKTERVLGLMWNPQNDSLGFNLNLARVPPALLDNAAPTKREILKIIMSIYDPLGLASPVIVRGKQIMQEVWRRGIGWDNKIDADLAEQWTTWLQHIKKLRDVTVPRAYIEYSEATSLQLHVFVDASTTAYAVATGERRTKTEK